MTSSEPDLPRQAAELVLEYDKTFYQAARILGCTVPAVRKFIQQYLDRSPRDADPQDTPPFVAVTLDEEGPAVSSPTIPLDILTPNGLTLRLHLSSLEDLITLLQSWEPKPC